MSVESFELEDGGKIKIVHDGSCEQPYTDDEAVKIVILGRRYRDPAEGECGKDADAVLSWVKKNKKEWFSIPLWLYDHSGTTYKVGEANPFDCPWDSGQVGILALKRSEWGNGNETSAKLTSYAQDIASEYTAWANGETYGYVVYDADGEQTDSCFGFVGIETVKDEIKSYLEPKQTLSM